MEPLGRRLTTRTSRAALGCRAAFSCQGAAPLDRSGRAWVRAAASASRHRVVPSGALASGRWPRSLDRPIRASPGDGAVEITPVGVAMAGLEVVVAATQAG